MSKRWGVVEGTRHWPPNSRLLGYETTSQSVSLPPAKRRRKDDEEGEKVVVEENSTETNEVAEKEEKEEESEEVKVKSAIPDLSLFSLETIMGFVNGEQNFNKGKLLACSAQVFDLSVSDDDGSSLFQGFVHAEMKQKEIYLVRCRFSPSLSAWCVCPASDNEHNKCKHVSALLCALLCVKNHPGCSSFLSMFVILSNIPFIPFIQMSHHLGGRGRV
jgi:hypothetical protein